MRNIIQAVTVAGVVAVSACPAAAGPPHWIWSHDIRQEVPGEVVYLRKTFEVKDVKSATVAITADNVYDLYVNGRFVGSDPQWEEMEVYDVAALLKPGKNVLAVKGKNDDGPGPAGLVAQLTVTDAAGQRTTIETDGTWKISRTPPFRWERPEFDDTKWAAATDLGEIGKTGPWGMPKVAGAVLQPGPPQPEPPPPVAKIDRRPFKFVDGDRVVFVGGTFIERAQDYGYIEAAITSRYPNENIIFRNLGWSGDTAYGVARSYFDAPEVGFNRLVKNLADFRPTVAVVSYGWSEAWDGEKGLKPFLDQMNRLVDVFDRDGTSVVIVTPPPHETPHGGSLEADAGAHNSNLRLYGEALRKLADERGAAFVDAYQVVGSAESQSVTPLTYNTIHLTDYGYYAVAPGIAAALGVGLPEWRLEVDVEKKRAAATGATVADAKFEGGGASLTLADAALPLPVHPGAPAGSGRVVRVAGLGSGLFTLKIDGQSVSTATGKHWATGVAITGGPEFAQAEAMRQAIIKKDANFFYRWRPANETYIFGFRKGEQGRNAVEMPRFDPIIAGLEKQIAELKKPVAHRYEIVAGGGN